MFNHKNMLRVECLITKTCYASTIRVACDMCYKDNDILVVFESKRHLRSLLLNINLDVLTSALFSITAATYVFHYVHMVFRNVIPINICCLLLSCCVTI